MAGTTQSNSGAASMTPDEVVRAAAAFRADFEAAREQIGRVVVGQGALIEQVLTCLFVGGHVLLEGVPGIGKTLLVRTLAQAVSLTFGRVQFTPDLMPADITGTTVVSEIETEAGRRERRFVFQAGPIFAQIVLADEINRATPKTQSALLEAMQERSVTVGGVTHRLPEPFIVLATQNPVEQEGTYPLPEAQLDRFFFKLISQPPTRQELAEILARTTGGVQVQAKPCLDAARLAAHQSLVRQVLVTPSVQDYAVRLVLGTHPNAAAVSMVSKYVRLGASPRAAQAIILAAKCRALLAGRVAVSTDDIHDAALPALRHRLIMNFESHAEGITSDVVIGSLLQALPREAP
jgi:MoxR-like ATPase